MHLFFRIQDLQLLKCDMNGQKLLAILDCVLLCLLLLYDQNLSLFTLIILLSCLIFSFLHIISLKISCGYVSIESIDCTLLSS